MIARRIHKELSILSLATSSAASCSHRNCTLRTILWTLNSPTTPVAGAAFHHVRRFPTRPMDTMVVRGVGHCFLFHVSSDFDSIPSFQVPTLDRLIQSKVARWQNLIPSFPWIAPGWRAWDRNPRKGRDQILQRSIAEP